MFGTRLRLNVSVGASNRTVIRAARRKLNPAVLRDRDKRAARKDFYRAMLRHHAGARGLVRSYKL